MAGILTQIQEADAKKRGLIPSEPYVHQEYPKWVRAKDGSKVLVENEDKHREVAPNDPELPENAPKGKPKGKKDAE